MLHESEVARAMNDLCLTSSTVSDGILARMIKLTAWILTPVLMSLFSDSLKLATFPAAW